MLSESSKQVAAEENKSREAEDDFRISRQQENVISGKLRIARKSRSSQVEEVSARYTRSLCSEVDETHQSGA